MDVCKSDGMARWKAYVTTAGTATDHGFNLFVGTTSVSAFAHGTSTAGSLLTAQTDIDVATGVQVSVKSLAARSRYTR